MEIAESFRIQEIRRATVAGRKVKTFKVYRQQNNGEFMLLGKFIAPLETPDDDLWLPGTVIV